VEFEASLADAFRRRTRLGYRTVGHNLAFDLKLSARHSVYPDAPLEDTMINEGLIDDIAGSFSLDSCSARRGVTAKLGDELYRELATRFGGLPDRKQMGNFWRLPGDLPVAVDYAVGDGVSTLELWAAQQPLLDELELRKVWKLECDLIPYLARMQRRGIKVDPAYAERVMVELEGSIDNAKRALSPGFNVRSPKELEALFRSSGVVDFAQTAGGKPSFTEKWLEGNDAGRAVLAVRRLEKARDSFITPLISTNNVQGRVHPVLNQSKSDEYGAIGGRLSCSEPNLQAFPKRNYVVGKLVRPLLIPDEQFEFMGEADFSQQEPRLFAHYSEDENLLRGYNGSPVIDIHSTASALLGMPRDHAKRLGLGILTGMQPKSLAGHMGYSVDDAARDHRRFLHDAFPGIEDFQQLAKRVFKSRGYVRTILGRIAKLDHPQYAYRAVSRIIQGSGADHTKTTLLRINQYAEAYPDEINILLTIHDSFIWQSSWKADNPKLREMVRIMEDVQSPPFNFATPIPVEVILGRNWGEASYGEKAKKVEGWV
jgi:DNA polymerase-1